MVTWLPSMTLRSERPCRKRGAAGLLGAVGRRYSLLPLLFFSVWQTTDVGSTFIHSFDKHRLSDPLAQDCQALAPLETDHGERGVGGPGNRWELGVPASLPDAAVLLPDSRERTRPCRAGPIQVLVPQENVTGVRGAQYLAS